MIPEPQEEDVFTEAAFNDLIAHARKREIKFDKTMISKDRTGATIQFYNNGKRVHVVHLCGVGLKPRKEKK